MPSLKAFAMKMTREREAADDLVQETVLRALAKREAFQPGTNLGAWLFTVMKNLWRSHYRKRRREVEDPDEALAKAMPTYESPLRLLEAKEALRAVDTLPDIWREPLRLVADGASIEEMASELREHDGTIKSRINRGREVLRRVTGGVA